MKDESEKYTFTQGQYYNLTLILCFKRVLYTFVSDVHKLYLCGSLQLQPLSSIPALCQKGQVQLGLLQNVHLPPHSSPVHLLPVH